MDVKNLAAILILKFNFFSNVLFRFTLALIVLEIMDVFRSGVSNSQKKNSKSLAFVITRGHNFDPSEIISEIVSSSSLTSFPALFLFSLRPIVAETDVGCSAPPPFPCRWLKILSASGARVNGDSNV